ncbi:MAG: DUF3737 family protein [Treponema sp.]|nr:DUF3737 family protein [Treponema sp.]
MDIENQEFDEERAFYNSQNVVARNCRFDGPADGESAFKESREILADHCYFNLRYPFWHNTDTTIVDSEMTDTCRAAIWYSKNIIIQHSIMHGIKAVRECSNVFINETDIISPEFGWSSKGLTIKNSTASSEYFLMNTNKVLVDNLALSGKYSFQYMKNSLLANSNLDTKDAFWHAKNVTIKNCTIKGEYIGWYSQNLTFENCTISGTQPFCYCKNLRLINCRLDEADLSFEKSSVKATLTAPVVSIKNPASGKIILPKAGPDENLNKIISTEKGSCKIIFV